MKQTVLIISIVALVVLAVLPVSAYTFTTTTPTSKITHTTTSTPTVIPLSRTAPNETNETEDDSKHLPLQPLDSDLMIKKPQLVLPFEKHYDFSYDKGINFTNSSGNDHLDIQIPKADYYVYVDTVEHSNNIGVGVFHPDLKQFITSYPMRKQGSSSTKSDGRMIVSENGRYIAVTRLSGSSDWIDIYDRYTDTTKRTEEYPAYRYYWQMRYGPGDVFCTIQNRGAGTNPLTYVQAVGPDGYPRITLATKDQNGDRVLSPADCAFNGDGSQLVVTDGLSQSLLFYDLATNELVNTIPLGTHAGWIASAGDTYVLRSTDAFLVVENGALARTFDHEGSFDAMALNDAGTILALAKFESNVITTIDTQSGNVLMNYMLGPARSQSYQCLAKSATSLAFAPDNTLYATICQSFLAINTDNHNIESWTLSTMSHPIAVAQHNEPADLEDMPQIAIDNPYEQFGLEVTKSYPEADENNVPLNAQLLVTFSQDVDPSSLSFKFYVRDDDYIRAKGTVEVVDKIVYFIPSENYKPQHHYTIYAEKGIKSTMGLGLLETFTTEFTTGTEEKEYVVSGSGVPDTLPQNDIPDLEGEGSDDEGNITMPELPPQFATEPILKRLGDFFKGIFGSLR